MIHLLFAVAAIAAASVVGTLVLYALRDREWGPLAAGVVILGVAFALGELAGRMLP